MKDRHPECSSEGDISSMSVTQKLHTAVEVKSPADRQSDLLPMVLTSVLVCIQHLFVQESMCPCMLCIHLWVVTFDDKSPKVVVLAAQLWWLHQLRKSTNLFCCQVTPLVQLCLPIITVVQAVSVACQNVFVVVLSVHKLWEANYPHLIMGLGWG